MNAGVLIVASFLASESMTTLRRLTAVTNVVLSSE
jgi:hypothetical protein